MTDWIKWLDTLDTEYHKNTYKRLRRIGLDKEAFRTLLIQLGDPKSTADGIFIRTSIGEIEVYNLDKKLGK